MYTKLAEQVARNVATCAWDRPKPDPQAVEKYAGILRPLLTVDGKGREEKARILTEALESAAYDSSLLPTLLEGIKAALKL